VSSDVEPFEIPVKPPALVILMCGGAFAILAAITTTKSNSPAKWQPGFVDALTNKNACDRLEADVARADFEVSVERNGHFDVGIGRIANGARSVITHSSDELQDFFKRQHRKEFVVVIYQKNAPDGDLAESIERLKTYFQNAGYKRILLLHAHSSGWIVHEDHRPATLK